MVKRDEKSSLFFYPDIYNKLYSMIKQTWEISNEERNRILSLHESATKNHYLMSEQGHIFRSGQVLFMTKIKIIDIIYLNRHMVLRAEYVD
jgi:hypothetical protein